MANESDWDDIADEFEQAWRDDAAPSIEYFAARARPGEYRLCLQALIEIELELRHRTGGVPNRDEYLSRFSEHCDEVKNAFGAFQKRCLEGSSSAQNLLQQHPDEAGNGHQFEQDSPRKENTPNADRNLLFGVLAWQAGVISETQLLGAMQTWTFSKTKPIGQVLVEQGAFPVRQREVVESMVDAYLLLHANNAADALSRMSSTPEVAKKLRRNIADSDIQGSVARMDGTTKTDPEATYVLTDPLTRFRIIRHYDNGALGNVFIARDQEVNRDVALKEIQLHLADDPDSRSRFLLEAEVTGGLEHPGIVPVYGMGQYKDGRPYYAMRFIKGRNLKSEITRFHNTQWSEQQRRLELRRLLGRFIDVCHAVHYAHSRGVLHRDLKPGNVMIGKYGETLVVDWGLARVQGRTEVQKAATDEATLVPETKNSRTQEGAIMGTPPFMSPEQMRGEIAALGPATDIYSLGATLYQLLTGALPFQGDDIRDRVMTGQFDNPSKVDKQVPTRLEAICLRAMALRPEDRFGSLEDLITEIEKWLADEPVQHIVATIKYFEAESISNPGVVEYSERLGRELSTLAIVLLSLQRTDEALSTVRRAIALLDKADAASDRERIRLRQEYLYARQNEIRILKSQGLDGEANVVRADVESELQKLYCRFITSDLRTDIISMSIHFGLKDLADRKAKEIKDLTRKAQLYSGNELEWYLSDISPEEREAVRQNLQAFEDTHHPFENEIDDSENTLHPSENERFDPEKEQGWDTGSFKAVDRERRYHLLGLIGKGGISDVYKAFDTALSRNVALKVAQRNSEQVDDLYTAEIKLLSQLQHPNIPHVFSAGRTNDGQLYYTMPLFDSQSIADRANSAPAEEVPVALMPAFLDVCDAINYVHQFGIINLDIKPANVLFSGNRPFLVDWGLAVYRPKSRTGDELLNWQPRREGGIAGTLAYMSPEQACEETARIDIQSDIFLLGGLLHYLLTREPPRNNTVLRGLPIDQLLTMVREQPISFELLNSQRNVPRVLGSVCRKALSFASGDRYQCVAEMLDAIKEWQDSRTRRAH